jgi:hypothetical protein
MLPPTPLLLIRGHILLREKSLTLYPLEGPQSAPAQLQQTKKIVLEPGLVP